MNGWQRPWPSKRMGWLGCFCQRYGGSAAARVLKGGSNSEEALPVHGGSDFAKARHLQHP
jgi:hypothetical protein